MLPVLPLVIGGILAFLSWFYLHFRRQYPPGPFPLPIIGNLHQISSLALHKDAVRLGKQYQGIFTLFLPKPIVFITDYDLIKQALVSQGDAFATRPEDFIFKTSTGGTSEKHCGIVNLSGAPWKHQRRFAMHVLRDFGVGKNIMQHKINTEVDRMHEHLDSLMDKKDSLELDIGPIIECSVSSIIASLIFGFSYEFGDKRFREVSDMSTEMFTIAKESLWVILADQFAIFESLPIPDIIRFKKCAKKVLTYFREQIDEHKAELDTSDVEAEASDFVGAYLKEMQRREQTGEQSQDYTKHQLVGICSDLWTAGFDTTVATLKWAVLFMCAERDVQLKAQKEIDSVVAAGQEVSLAHKTSMPYMNAVLTEVQRCGNIVTLNVPHATNTQATVGGHKIQKGTTVRPEIYCCMADERVYPNHEHFDPTRFLDDGGNQQNASQLARRLEQVVPFSLGKRQCMGESLARSELFLILTSLLHKYEFYFADAIGPAKPYEPILSLTASPPWHKVCIKKRPLP